MPPDEVERQLVFLDCSTESSPPSLELRNSATTRAGEGFLHSLTRFAKIASPERDNLENQLPDGETHHRLEQA
jgi:hypothetical protein